MCKTFSSMHCHFATSAMTAEAAASVCAVILVGSAIMAGPIFIRLVLLCFLVHRITISE